MFIYTREDFRSLVLPGPGSQGGEEGLHLDFKGAAEQGPHGHRNTAIDLAAFANATGGVVVFGVREDRMRPKFAGEVTPDFDAAATVEHVENAISVHTHGFHERPRPVPLEVDGGRVVIVNVPPSARLVSVRGADGRSIMYPFRHAHGNDYLKAEEVAHRLDSRRGFVARNQLDTWLRGFGENGRPVHLYFLRSPPNTGVPRRNEAWDESKLGTVNLAAVTPDGAKLLFLPPAGLVPVSFVVPYEWIVSVWWNGNRVAIQIAAFIGLDGNLIKAYPMPW